MNPHPPLVLIASVSTHERNGLEHALERTGFRTLVVDGAEAVSAALASSPAPTVLVIDSGLLEAPHDAQWRSLRTRHPELGTVVRCLRPRHNGSECAHDRTLLVHPDDEMATQRAVRTLAAMVRCVG